MPLFFPFVLISWENQQIYKSLFFLLLLSIFSFALWLLALSSALQDQRTCLTVSSAHYLKCCWAIGSTAITSCNKGLFGHGSVQTQMISLWGWGRSKQNLRRKMQLRLNLNYLISVRSCFLFIGVQLLYQVALVPAVQQSESVTPVPVSPSSMGFPFLFGSPQSTEIEFPGLYSKRRLSAEG